MAFRVTRMDLHLRETGRAHHTDDYENRNWVVRRGDPFEVTLNCSNFDTNRSKFQVHLKGGPRPSRRNCTWLVLDEAVTEDSDEHWYKIITKSSSQVKIKVFLPHDALVSSYDFSVVDLATRKEYPADRKLYVLFNPWNRKDQVFMEVPMDKRDDRMEYVLADSGYVYTGKRAKAWNFGQFTDAALKCTFKLLESAPITSRDSAHDVARHISAVGSDLVAGNWSGNFAGGRAPWEWTGSVGIFKKYLETGQIVKWGQCWVFSGVATSMMRCLGIPVRSVTNIQSCHDKDGNCTNDVYFDENGYKIKHLSKENPWNFHVWNDVWMARPDLPEGNDGWQAMDGTPQELSGGMYRCGPAPLRAIKEGNVNMGFDTKFVFAEVNADTVHWQKDSTGHWKAIRIKPNAVGWNLFTKRPHQNATDDVMEDYKYKDGSAEERRVMRRVMRKVGNPCVEPQAEDIKFKAKAPWEVQMDEGITLTVNAENKENKVFNIVARVTTDVVSYDGSVLKTLENRSQEKQISQGSESFAFKYEAYEFAEFYENEISIRFTINARVKETNQVYATEKICKVERPELKVELISGSAEVTDGDKIKVRITIPKPPAGKRYTDPFLVTESSINMTCMTDGQAGHVSRDEAERGVIEREFLVDKMEKNKTGLFGVTFNSKELSGISGELQLKYKAPSTLPPIDYIDVNESFSEWWDRFMSRY